MKKFLKIFSVGFLSLAIILASCFIPIKLKQDEISLNKASASVNPPSWVPPTITVPPNDNTESDNLYFIGSDFFYSTLGLVRTDKTTIPDFTYFVPGLHFDYTDYLAYSSDSPWYKFQLALSLNGNILNFNLKATNSSNSYISNANSLVPDGYGNFCNVSSFNLDDFASSFTPDVINRSTKMSQYLKVYSNNDGWQNSNVIYYANTFIGSDVIFKSSSYVRPSLQIKSIDFTNSLDFESIYGITPSFANSNIIVYTDTTDYSFVFYIPSCANFLAFTNDSIKYTYLYKFRRYYTESAFDFDDNDYYNQGVTDGFNDGYNEGETKGYSEGYSSGLATGKNLGYNEGLQANDRLTFTGLMTSVIDVPVKVFVSLFDFDILGVNILVFLSTLLTICLVLFLIKKIKGA